MSVTDNKHKWICEWIELVKVADADSPITSTDRPNSTLPAVSDAAGMAENSQNPMTDEGAPSLYFDASLLHILTDC